MVTLRPARRARARARRLYHAYRDRGKPPLHLLHPGKTGGTAIKHVMSGTFARNYRFVLHPHTVTLADIPPGEQVCFVVRDPATRFVSGFNSRLRKGGDAHSVEWTDAERRAFTRFRTADDLACALFSEDPETAAAAAAAVQAVRHLRMRQVDWVVDLDTLLQRSQDVVFIGRQWALGEDFARLVRITGMPSHTTLPTGAAAHRTPAGMSTTLSEKGRRAVLRWYAGDVALLAELERTGAEFGYVPDEPLRGRDTT